MRRFRYTRNGVMLAVLVAIAATGGTAVGAIMHESLDSDAHVVSEIIPGNPGVYSTNSAGQTFGAWQPTTHPQDAPDLILVEFDAGRLGYVYAVEFFGSVGWFEMPTSPEEALRRQAEDVSVAPPVLTVFDSDGETILGEWHGLTAPAAVTRVQE